MSDNPPIFDIIYNCRAMRRLKRDEVPEALLLKLVDAANQGPTASNMQPGRWIIVRDPAVKERLAELNREAIAGSYPPPDPNAPKSAFQWQAEHMGEIPALIVACVEIGPGRKTESFHDGMSVGGSIWPAVQNLLLAARALGLGACPTTLPLADGKAAREALGLPERIRPICLIPVGYPRGRFGPVTRRPLSEIMRFDRWE